jgi:ATP-dependent DNA helicase RecG
MSDSVSHSGTLAEMSIAELKGVGPISLEKLLRMGIETVLDLLLHIPVRYEDRSRLSRIRDLVVDETTNVEGRILSASVVFKGRRQFQCQLQDDSGVLTIRFFHFNAEQQHTLSQVGTPIRVYGQVRFGRAGKEMIHPSYQLGQAALLSMTAATHYTPVYRTIKGLQARFWLKLITQASALVRRNPSLIRETIPARLRGSLRLPTMADALVFAHQPPMTISFHVLQSKTHPMFKRLALEELLAHQLALSFSQEVGSIRLAPKMSDRRFEIDSLSAQLVSHLPFELTNAQQRVIAEIARDCDSEKPMIRLLQGDVGSGKTLVAALAVCQALDSGYQAAVMAPTEILTTQHVQNFKRWLGPLGVQIDCLVGSLGAKARRETLARLEMGITRVVVGTHALFQETVVFKQLGLLVIDEQHRFGVSERLALRNKSRPNEEPHQLMMTATPIPRSLAMTAYSHCDHSILDELPKGRQPIHTALIASSKRKEVMQRLQDRLDKGARVYWVCPLIEESEHLVLQTVEDSYKELRDFLPQYRIELLHGKLSSADKEAVMQRFSSGESQVLVATTVIEVGVDVPEATVMVIENAERFGLAQLHQLRGRIGRGAYASYCILMYSNRLSQAGRERLQIMRKCSDGFAIAEADLRQRGPGELLGERQAGFFEFQIANWQRDADLLPIIQAIIQEMNDCEKNVYHSLAKNWIKNNQKWLQG